ncbi:hypothetical protein AAFF_G00087800 [Aldrovandia affinis]|uniref:Uncharacterized protein n=1 Tax=Aldrovandia affinis TaxID=143900 RepID=A0AAD7RWM2_9TELE|nr:hypothetical protein AAFF_G00087800 [Aldrovandia affinis]
MTTITINRLSSLSIINPENQFERYQECNFPQLIPRVVRDAFSHWGWETAFSSSPRSILLRHLAQRIPSSLQAGRSASSETEPDHGRPSAPRRTRAGSPSPLPLGRTAKRRPRSGLTARAGLVETGFEPHP